jgi:phosphoribosylformylglycinamidine synthase PurS subunit
MKAVVAVSFRPGVLDPEAAAISRSLHGLGFDSVREVRRTRLIELELDETDGASAEAKVRTMCEKLLTNPVIESYRVELGG